MEEDKYLLQTQRAIEAALNNSWSEAVSLNEAILKAKPKDVETLNRLGRAYMESGLVGKAKTTYKKVLELDPYNSIAAKNIEKLTGLTKKDIAKAAKNAGNGHTLLSANLFLEETGKTKVIGLEDLAMSKILATLHTADRVNLDFKGADVIVTINDKRLGKLPTEYATRISQAGKSGSKFNAIIKSVLVRKGKNEASISIFVRETFHSPKLGTTPVFPSNNSHLTSFVREDTLPLMENRSDMVMETGDESLEETTPLSMGEDQDDQTRHGPVVEDEEEFHS